MKFLLIKYTTQVKLALVIKYESQKQSNTRIKKKNITWSAYGKLGNVFKSLPVCLRIVYHVESLTLTVKSNKKIRIATRIERIYNNVDDFKIKKILTI